MGMCGNCNWYKLLDKKLAIGECQKIKNMTVYGNNENEKCYEERVEYFSPWKI